MNNQKHTLTATVGFVLAKGTKIHEDKTLKRRKKMLQIFWMQCII